MAVATVAAGEAARDMAEAGAEAVGTAIGSGRRPALPRDRFNPK